MRFKVSFKEKPKSGPNKTARVFLSRIHVSKTCQGLAITLLMVLASVSLASPKKTEAREKQEQNLDSVSVRLENPIRGWRVGKSEVDTVQPVTYPASSVNMNREYDTSQQIRGQVKGWPKAGPKKPPAPGQYDSEAGDEGSTQKPLTLVINGLDMPQKHDGEVFARPFAFNRGSNSVEVKFGKSRHAVQFYETNLNITPIKMRVLLSWDSDHTDLDLHLVTPDGEHCFYGNRRLKSGAALDVDVTTGYGPEIISVPSPRRGTYMVYVNYYGSGRGTGKLTTAKVTIVTEGGSPDEKIETALVPLRAPGELNLVKTFKY